MEYLVTWIEGEEVAYLILGKQDLCHISLEEKNHIITELKSTH